MKALTHVVRTLAACLLLLTAVGCATSGQKFSELKAGLPEPQEGQGRIFLYRTSALGAAVQPAIAVNGEAIGAATPKAFYYLDRPAGTYEIVTSTEVKRTLSFALQPGQTRYVRLNISMGFFVGHVWPELVENAVGEKEIRKCHLRNK